MASVLKVDKLDPQSGTALEIGTSGDTISIGGTNLDLGDSKKIRLGASQDLEIYHDASNSYIHDTGTGYLLIKGSQVVGIQDANGNAMITATAGTDVKLYYDNSQKFATVTGGATVTGVCTATSFAGNGSALTGLTPGITEYDQWRITADAAQTGSGRTVLTANWERSDTNFEVIGSGMSESSGIFTFPSTGKWLVQSGQMWSSYDGSSNYAHVYVYHEIQNTTDDSSYGRIARSVSSNSNAAAEYYQNGYVSTMIDITDVSNDKVCISAYRANGLTWKGSSSAQDTGVSFMKLGDT